MTLRTAYAIDGATYYAPQVRMMTRAASHGAQGVVESGDLAVRELAVPGDQVRITNGQALISGRDGQALGTPTGQGTYAVWNQGDHLVAIAATDSSGPRTDLLCVRVEDSTWPGAGWTHDATTEALVYPFVIQGVPAGTETIPAAYTFSAIALARIEIPTSTATITQSMVKDVRRLAQPRRERQLRVQRGGTMSDGVTWDDAGNIDETDGYYERWPQHDWTVPIPAWATQVQVLANWDNVFLEPTGGAAGTEDARGRVKIHIEDSAGTAIETAPSAYNFNQTSTTNGYRCSLGNRDQIPIPAPLRGTTAEVRMYVQGTSGQAGRLVADNWANFSADLEFLEVPAPEAGS